MSYNGPRPEGGSASTDGNPGGGCFAAILAFVFFGFIAFGFYLAANDKTKLRAGELVRDKLTGEVGIVEQEPRELLIPREEYAVRYESGKVRWHKRSVLIRENRTTRNEPGR